MKVGEDMFQILSCIFEKRGKAGDDEVSETLSLDRNMVMKAFLQLNDKNLVTIRRYVWIEPTSGGRTDAEITEHGISLTLLFRKLERYLSKGELEQLHDLLK
jgi:transcription initiation factor IIE alpha subunit